MDNNDNQFQTYLTNLSRHVRLRDNVYFVGITIWLPLLIASFIELSAHQFPIPNRHGWAILPMIVWACAVFLFGYFRPLPLKQVARRLDSEFRLKDRLTTAWEFGATNLALHVKPSFDASASLYSLQLADALAVIQRLDPRQLAWQIPRRRLWLATIFIAIAITLALLPNRMDKILSQQALIKEIAHEQANIIIEEKKEFEQTTDALLEERVKALQALQELSQELSANHGDLENALAEISNVESELQKLHDEDALKQLDNLEQIADQLQAVTSESTNSSSDTNDLSEQLAELANSVGDMDNESRTKLAQQLTDMAAQSAPTDAELANALQDLANAVQEGDVTTTAQSAESLQQEMSQIRQQANFQSALESAQQTLSDSRQAFNQASQGQSVQAQADADNGQGQGQNQGQNQGSGGGGGGGGTQADQLPGRAGSGSAQDPSRPNQDAELGEGISGDSTSERYDTQGNPLFVSGDENPDGSMAVREGMPSIGLDNLSFIRDDGRLIAIDGDTYTEMMEHDEIPVEWEDYVKAYFAEVNQ